MPREPHNPAKPGEHSTLKGKSKATEDDEDDSRTERMSPFREALEASEKLWEQGTGQS